jgi:hypothetical protein
MTKRIVQKKERSANARMRTLHLAISFAVSFTCIFVVLKTIFLGASPEAYINRSEYISTDVLLLSIFIKMIPLVLIVYFASFVALAKAAPMNPFSSSSGWFSGSGSGSNQRPPQEHYPTHSQHENAPPVYTNEYQGNHDNVYNPDPSSYFNQPYYVNQPDYGNQPYYYPTQPTVPDYYTTQYHQPPPQTTDVNYIDTTALPAYDPYAASPEAENVDYAELQRIMREQSEERQRSSSSHGRQKKGKETATSSKQKTSFLSRMFSSRNE